jgi:SAM-dependent methyltransferase
MLRADARVLGVGAGHERILFWLANRVGRVFATDLYGNATWTQGGAIEGDPTMLTDPGHFAKAPYRREALTVLPMDGRALAFADETMDAVYSLSSIEHFGADDEIRRTMREMARVLKPGGVAAVATELVLNGVPRGETFTPDQLADTVIRPSGLKLVQPIDWTLSMPDFLAPVRLDRDPHALPHLFVRKGRTLFTSVTLFLRKV